MIVDWSFPKNDRNTEINHSDKKTLFLERLFLLQGHKIAAPPCKSRQLMTILGNKKKNMLLNFVRLCLSIYLWRQLKFHVSAFFISGYVNYKVKKYFLRVYHSCDLVGLKEITIEKKRITWKIQKKLALLRILQTHLPSNVTFNIHVPSLNMNKSIKFLTVSINQLSKNWLFSRVDRHS